MVLEQYRAVLVRVGDTPPWSFGERKPGSVPASLMHKGSQSNTTYYLFTEAPVLINTAQEGKN